MDRKIRLELEAAALAAGRRLEAACVDRRARLTCVRQHARLRDIEERLLALEGEGEQVEEGQSERVTGLERRLALVSGLVSAAVVRPRPVERRRRVLDLAVLVASGEGYEDEAMACLACEANR